MNKLAWLIALLLWILLALWLSNKYLCNRNLIAGGVIPGLVDNGCRADFFGAPLSFTKSSSDLPDETDAVSQKITELSQRLLDNPSELVEITGCYGNDETNDSLFDNLGLARANIINEWLMDNGVSPDQIELSSVECDEQQWKDGKLINGICIDFSQVTAQASSISNETNSSDVFKSEASIEGPLVLNYWTNQEKITLTDAQRINLGNMISQGGSIDVVGHTDDEEYDEIALSLNRASLVKKYLISNMNIDPSKVSIYGYGSDRGIAENCSPAGRAKNRRVEIIAR